MTSSSILKRLRCQTGLTDGAIEQLAEELHGDYRAANKALSNEPEIAYRTSSYKGMHDHGWAKCHKKDYFRQRASRKLLDRLKAASESKEIDLSPLTPNEQRTALLKLFRIAYVNHPVETVNEVDLTNLSPEAQRDSLMKLFRVKPIVSVESIEVDGCKFHASGETEDELRTRTGLIPGVVPILREPSNEERIAALEATLIDPKTWDIKKSGIREEIERLHREG